MALQSRPSSYLPYQDVIVSLWLEIRPFARVAFSHVVCPVKNQSRMWWELRKSTNCADDLLGVLLLSIIT